MDSAMLPMGGMTAEKDFSKGFNNLTYIIKDKENCKKYWAVFSNNIVDSFSVIVILGLVGV